MKNKLHVLLQFFSVFIMLMSTINTTAQLSTSYDIGRAFVIKENYQYVFKNNRQNNGQGGGEAYIEITNLITNEVETITLNHFDSNEFAYTFALSIAVQDVNNFVIVADLKFQGITDTAIIPVRNKQIIYSERISITNQNSWGKPLIKDGRVYVSTHFYEAGGVYLGGDPNDTLFEYNGESEFFILSINLYDFSDVIDMTANRFPELKEFHPPNISWDNGNLFLDFNISGEGSYNNKTHYVGMNTTGTTLWEQSYPVGKPRILQSKKGGGYFELIPTYVNYVIGKVIERENTLAIMNNSRVVVKKSNNLVFDPWQVYEGSDNYIVNCSYQNNDKTYLQVHVRKNNLQRLFKPYVKDINNLRNMSNPIRNRKYTEVTDDRITLFGWYQAEPDLPKKGFSSNEVIQYQGVPLPDPMPVSSYMTMKLVEYPVEPIAQFTPQSGTFQLNAKLDADGAVIDSGQYDVVMQMSEGTTLSTMEHIDVSSVTGGAPNGWRVWPEESYFQWGYDYDYYKKSDIANVKTDEYGNHYTTIVLYNSEVLMMPRDENAIQPEWVFVRVWLVPSGTLAVHTPVALQGTVVYPNPVQDNLFIRSNEQINDAYVYDMTGKLVKKKKIASGTATINMQDLSNGIYIMKLRSEKGVFAIKKIVKQ